MGLELKVMEGGYILVDDDKVSVKEIDPNGRWVKLSFSFPEHVSIDRPLVRWERIKRLKSYSPNEQDE